jgi:hypothetical protein
MSIENKQNLLLKNLLQFLSNEKHMKTLTDVVYFKKDVSLRSLDFLVTNYAKTHNIVVKNKKETLQLHQLYRLYLKGYSKQQFDPFKRHIRIHIPCFLVPDGVLETTVAQLNFFKFAIDHNVIQYLKDHKKVVEDEMDSFNYKKIVVK